MPQPNQPGLSPLPAALIATPRDDLCLEFIDTRYWRGTDQPTEGLAKLDDVLDWFTAMGTASAATLAPLRDYWRDNPKPAARVFEASVALRETLFRIFSAIAAAHPPAAEDLATLNAALARAPARLRLESDDGQWRWRVDKLKPDMPSLLAPVLWSAADLLARPARQRVRSCANAKCLWLFLDDSRSGTRRWCSMSACGNRAKAHRHYLRQKAK